MILLLGKKCLQIIFNKYFSFYPNPGTKLAQKKVTIFEVVTS